MRKKGFSRRAFLRGGAATVAMLSAKRPKHAMAATKTTWTNWSQSVSVTPKSFETPSTDEKLVSIVRKAAKKGRGVRVAGSGHSFVPVCASEDLMISLDNLQGVVDIDSEKLQARVLAGTKLFAMGEPLWNAGMSLSNQGDVDRQALAGAVGTGTHGTGKDLPNMSNFAIGFRLITGTGEVIECSETENRDVFKAAQVSLGVLGVMTHITLQLEPAFKLHERNVSVPYEEGMPQLARYIQSNRNFEFFFTVKNDMMIMKTLTVTDEADKGFEDGERIGPAYQVYPTARDLKFNEIEFTLPEANGPDCIGELRDLMNTKYGGVAWPVEFRTVKGDDIPISAHSGRDSVAISCHQSYRRPHEEFFKDCQAIFLNHDGRPHWGKMHWLKAAELREMYPRWAEFQRIRAELDPKGMFLSKYTRELFVS